MKKIIVSGLTIVLLSGCGYFQTTTNFLSKIFSTKTNSIYYEKKVFFLIDKLVNQIKTENPDQTINKVAVMDLVDHDGRVPALGQYISLKIMNEISNKKYFKLVQRGDLLSTIERLHINTDSFDVSSSKELGDALQIEAIITGRIIDLGTNLDVNVNSVAVKTGEVIASASESFARSNFAMEMLRRY